jgi:hypothetical protein
METYACLTTPMGKGLLRAASSVAKSPRPLYVVVHIFRATRVCGRMAFRYSDPLGISFELTALLL